MNFIIRSASINDIPIIHQLAEGTWPAAYTDILPAEQIRLMLDKMYSSEALQEQFESGVEFLIAERENQPVGFAGFSPAEPESFVFKLHKLYVLPSEQGKGTGKSLIEEIEAITRNRGGKILELNVNRSNPSLEFYKKRGFEIYAKADIPYYQFVMDDYVMRKEL